MNDSKVLVVGNFGDNNSNLVKTWAALDSSKRMVIVDDEKNMKDNPLAAAAMVASVLGAGGMSGVASPSVRERDKVPKQLQEEAIRKAQEKRQRKLARKLALKQAQ